MLEIVVFVLALAMANLLSGIVIMAVTFKMMGSDWFIKKYTKMAKKATEYAIGELFDSEEKEEEVL